MTWALMAPLDEDQRRELLAATRRRHFAKGEVLFHEGDPADSLHLVESGFLSVLVATPDGDQAMLNILSAGDTVGELSLLHDGVHRPRSATVAALFPAETRVLSATTFRELCADTPGVQVLLTELLSMRVRELSERLLETMYVGFDRRLYRRLVDLARLFADGEPGAEPVIPLTQDQLADLVGGTRPTVNLALQKLRGRGVIELGRGRVVVRDLPTLTRLAAY